MKQPLNEQFRRMQKLAGIITESQFTEAESITITKIEKGKDTGMEFGAIGTGYTITLSNGKTVESNDDDLLGRYSEIRKGGRKSLDQLNKILVGKSWDIDENQIQEMNMDVKTILTNNGIDDDYFESMGEKSIETGTEEWLDVLSDVTGKDAYTAEFDEEDEAKIQAFMQKLEALGIELI
jgi:hypothetical protein